MTTALLLSKKLAADFNADITPESTYFLWSLERVAVLLNCNEIEGKDWFGWGAQILIKKQEVNGSWYISLYFGSSPHIDSCFALLFLVRSNLAQEVTEQIQLQSPLRGGK